jgi:hypothetical protein
VSNKRSGPSNSSHDRKSLRDKRVAALSLDLVNPEGRRSTRALTQALLAGELHDAIILCVKADLPMPLASLLRSLIDTAVLGIWLVKYALSEEVAESVASLSTPETIKERFDPEDRKMFAFVFEPVNRSSILSRCTPPGDPWRCAAFGDANQRRTLDEGVDSQMQLSCESCLLPFLA